MMKTVIFICIAFCFGCATPSAEASKIDVDATQIYGEWILAKRFYKEKVRNIEPLKTIPIKIDVNTIFYKFSDGNFQKQQCTITKGKFEIDSKRNYLILKHGILDKQKILFLDQNYLLLASNDFTYFFKRPEK